MKDFTLDFAIEREEERARLYKEMAAEDYIGDAACERLAKEHEQMAIWLKELKRIKKDRD